MRALVACGGGIGDTVAATSCLHVLARRYEVDVACSLDFPGLRELLHGPFVKKLFWRPSAYGIKHLSPLDVSNYHTLKRDQYDIILQGTSCDDQFPRSIQVRDSFHVNGERYSC